MTVIDTCSLLNIVRYYLPFDKDSVLLSFIKSKLISGDVVVIDQVVKQSGWVNQSEILKAIPFLKEHQTTTGDLLPDKQFFHWLHNDFKDKERCRDLTPEEFETQKINFTNDADVKMLLFCNKHREALMPARLLTDETGKNNDCKYFKKLPTLCKIMGIDCIELATFFKEYDLIKINPPVNSLPLQYGRSLNVESST